MRPNPLHDVLVFLFNTQPLTLVFWLLLAGSLGFVLTVRARAGANPHDGAIWLLRLLTGAMWWQQSLWKVPPQYNGLIYWMKQEVAHASTGLQSALVADLVLPNIAFFGPLVYAIEVAIGVSLILGLFTRLGALLGVLMAANLWLGLYSAPHEWPWTYFFLIIIMSLFLVDPPGRRLGADAMLRRRGAGGLLSLLT
ncbi:MAG: DoxX family protein [Acetobacteraceae bacterium]